MNKKHSRLKSTALTTTLLLTTMVYATPSFAVNADKLETVNFSNSERTSLTRAHEIDQPQIPPPPSNSFLTWFPLSCLGIYVVVSAILIFYDNILDYLKNTFVAIPKIPCHSCQFFNDNYYLKCAVRPCAALTQDAIDCSDYYPRKDGIEQKLLK